MGDKAFWAIFVCVVVQVHPNTDELTGVCACAAVQVQPDMEELTENAEDIAEEGESKQSEQKLGRLQFKVRIDCPKLHTYGPTYLHHTYTYPTRL